MNRLIHHDHGYYCYCHSTRKKNQTSSFNLFTNVMKTDLLIEAAEINYRSLLIRDSLSNTDCKFIIYLAALMHWV